MASGVSIGDGIYIDGRYDGAGYYRQYCGTSAGLIKEEISSGESPWGTTFKWKDGYTCPTQLLIWDAYRLYVDKTGTYQLYAKNTYGSVKITVDGVTNTKTCNGRTTLVWEGTLTEGDFGADLSVTITGATSDLRGIELSGDLRGIELSGELDSSSSSSSSYLPITRVITDIQPSTSVGGVIICTCYDVILCYRDPGTGEVIPYDIAADLDRQRIYEHKPLVPEDDVSGCEKEE